MLPEPSFSSPKPPFNFGESVSPLLFFNQQSPYTSSQRQTPYEILFNKMPPYDNFRVFGCLCHAAIPLPHRHKFTPRTTPTVFMGYPLGYKVYDISTKKFIISRDVHFVENKFPFHTIKLTASPDPFPETVLPIPITEPLPNHDPIQSSTTTPNDQPNVPTPVPAATDPPAVNDRTNDQNDIPTTDQTANPTPVLRRSTRPHVPPYYLNTYIHQTTYPIQDQITYAHLSKHYHSYILKLKTHYISQNSITKQ